MGYYRENTLVRVVDVGWILNLPSYGRVLSDLPGTWQPDMGNYVQLGEEVIWCFARNLIVVEDLREVREYFKYFFTELLPDMEVHLLQDNNGDTKVLLDGLFTADDLQVVGKHLRLYRALVGETTRE